MMKQLPPYNISQNCIIKFTLVTNFSKVCDGNMKRLVFPDIAKQIDDIKSFAIVISIYTISMKTRHTRMKELEIIQKKSRQKN